MIEKYIFWFLKIQIHFHWANCYRYCWQTVYKCGEMKVVRRECPVDDVRAPSSFICALWQKTKRYENRTFVGVQLWSYTHWNVYGLYIIHAMSKTRSCNILIILLSFFTPSHHSHIYTHTHTHIYIYIYIYTLYICVCIYKKKIYI